MRNFSRGKPSFGGRDRRESPQMHRAICADCGQSCEVPFKPSRDKDVYCNNCFKRESSSRDSRDERRGQQTMHKATCADCGKRCEVPFKPSKDKAIYCDECFGGARTGGDSFAAKKPMQPNPKQDEILVKLDKILALLQSLNKAKEEPTMKAEKVEIKKEETPKKEVKKVVVKKEVAPKKITKKIILKKKSK